MKSKRNGCSALCGPASIPPVPTLRWSRVPRPYAGHSEPPSTTPHDAKPGVSWNEARQVRTKNVPEATGKPAPDLRNWIQRMASMRLGRAAAFVAFLAFGTVAWAQPDMRAEREIETELERERLQDEADRDADAWNASLRGRAHAGMAEAGDFYASPEICPVNPETAKDAGRPLRSKDVVPFATPRYFASPTWRGVASQNSSAASIFGEFISGPVVQAKCANCHVQGGISGHTRLVFSLASEPDHESSNLAVFQEFLQNAEDGADTILAKIQGVAHGGGVQVPAGSAEFANMESFLRELGGVTGGGGIPVDELFDGVTMAPPARTLRRAALV